MVKAVQYLINGVRLSLSATKAHNIVVLTIGQYVATALGFITTVILARLLGPNKYGQAVMIMAYPSLLLSLASFKSITVSTRYLASFLGANQKEKLRAICKVSYGVDFLAFLLPFVITGLTGWIVTYRIYHLPTEMFWLMLTYSASFPFLSLRGTSYAVLTAFEKFRLLALCYVIEQVATLTLVITLLSAGLRVSGMILGMAGGHIMIGFVSFYVATSLLSREGIGSWWNASFESIRPLGRELFSFYGWNYLMVTMSGLITQVPVMLLGWFRGPQETGFYRLAMSLMNIFAYPKVAAGRVVYPRLSVRWGRGEKQGSIMESLKRWMIWGGLPLSLAILLLIPFLPVLVPFILGNSYYSMVPGLQVLMLAAAAGAFFFWLLPYYYALGRIAAWTKAYALYTVVVLALGWLSIQWWGFLGMVIVLAIGETSFLFLMASRAILHSI